MNDIECLSENTINNRSYTFRCNLCNRLFIGTIRNNKFPECDLCNPPISNKYISKLEIEIRNFIKDRYNCYILCNQKSYIYPYELDIVLPINRIAIEVNGDFWHTEEKGRGEEYHNNKKNLCKNIGFELLFIWEHEWNDDKDKIIKMLDNKIGF